MTVQHEFRVLPFRVAATIGNSCFCFLFIVACAGLSVGNFALPVALIATPLLIAGGYGLQYLFLDKDAFHDRSENFIPDENVEFLTRYMPFLSYILLFGAGAGLGYLTLLLLGASLAGDGIIGGVLLMFSFAYTACVGGNVAARRAISYTYNDHIIEISIPYVVCATLFSAVGSPFPLFIPLLYTTAFITLCAYAFLFNQLSLAKLSARAVTCHITKRMMLSSIRDLSVILLLGSLTFLASLSVAGTLYALYQILLLLFVVSVRGAGGIQSVGFRAAVFGDFPTRSIPLNIALFTVGSIILVALIFFFTYGRAPAIRRAIFGFFGRMHDRMTLRPSAKRAQIKAYSEQQAEYSDYIAPAAERRAARYYPDDLKSIERAIAAIPDGRERLSYAYRLMVDRLVRAKLGVSVTDTPREIAEILRRRGVMQDCAELSLAFEWAAYAGKDSKMQPPGQPLERIMQIIRVYTVK